MLVLACALSLFAFLCPDKPTTLADRPAELRTALADGPAELRAALGQVEATLARGDSKRARRLLDDALAAHAEQTYVRDCLPAIEGHLAALAFAAAHPRKSAQDVVHGEVVAWNAKSGAIELRYSARDARRWKQPGEVALAGDPRAAFPLGDFAEVDGYLVHDAPFVGPCAIELRGRAIGEGVPRLRACVEDATCFEFSYDASNLSRAARLTGSQREELESTSTFFNVLRPYELKLAVQAKKVLFTFDGKKMLEVEKAKTTWGRFAFRDVATLEEIRVEGKLDPVSIEGRIDAIAQKERAAFAATYDPQADLPAWLRTAPVPPPK